jgi:hypothetical protein
VTRYDDHGRALTRSGEAPFYSVDTRHSAENDVMGEQLDMGSRRAVFGYMRPTLVGVLLLLVCSSVAAQVRVGLGLAAGQQPYEPRDLGSRFLLSPEAQLSYGRIAVYYALDYANLSSTDIRRGKMYASHLGLACRWSVWRNVAVRAGAGPSYVSITYLGGKPTWHAQLELSLRKERLEWFAKVRYYDYSLSEFRVAGASPDGPALLAGVRVIVTE